MPPAETGVGCVRSAASKAIVRIGVGWWAVRAKVAGGADAARPPASAWLMVMCIISIAQRPHELRLSAAALGPLGGQRGAGFRCRGAPVGLPLL